MVSVRARTNGRKRIERKGDRRDAFIPAKEISKHPRDVNYRKRRTKARLEAKKFVARREGSCCICGGKVWIGQTIQKLDQGWRHDSCRRKEDVDV